MPITVRHSGVVGNEKYISGDWSGNSGDASQTFAVASNFIESIDFHSEDADVTKEVPQISTSVTSGITTISVHNHMNVTNGKFRIVFR